MADGLSMSDGGDGPAEPRARCGGAQDLRMEGWGKGVNWTEEQLAIGVRKTPSRDQIRIEENIKTRTLENHKGAAPKFILALRLPHPPSLSMHGMFCGTCFLVLGAPRLDNFSSIVGYRAAALAEFRESLDDLHDPLPRHSRASNGASQLEKGSQEIPVSGG